jgi:hypothetical protein
VFPVVQCSAENICKQLYSVSNTKISYLLLWISVEEYVVSFKIWNFYHIFTTFMFIQCDLCIMWQFLQSQQHVLCEFIKPIRWNQISYLIKRLGVEGLAKCTIMIFLKCCIKVCFQILRMYHKIYAFLLEFLIVHTSSSMMRCSYLEDLRSIW